jgi:phospholipid/cholesterol/gamma-HCH transport system substrate-binding protein
MSTVNSADSYEVIADFQNIGGLKPRAPVKSAGVVVGRVADIRFDNEKYEAAVTLRLDKRYAFPKDSSAAIMTSGLLGEQYVGLEAGGDNQKLKDKDRILITQDAVVLENLIGQFLYGKAQEGAPK